MQKFIRFAIGLAFGVGFMIVWTILELNLTDSAIKSTLQIGAGIIFALAGFYFMFKSKPEEDTRAADARIEAMRQSGQPLTNESEVPFSPEDINVFRKRRKFLIPTMIAGLLFIPAMIALFIYVIAKPENRLLYQIIGVVVSVILFAGLGMNDYKNLTNDMKSGRKTIVRGIVTRKRIDGDRERGQRFLEIDTLSIFVSNYVYNKYRVGDGIEVHIYKPRRNMLLFDKKLDA